MKKFAVLDCETDPFCAGRIPQPFVWGLYNPEFGYKQFLTIKEVMEFLDGLDLRIYAHNGGKFDFHYMLEYIPDWKKVVMINGRLAQFRIDKLEFCDSYCILPVPLSAYQKTKVDYKIFEKEEREKPENWQIISSYLKDDCIFTYELISEFIQEHGHSLTIASCAMKTLQKIEDIKVPNSGRVFFEAIRPYYFGGRVECFKKGILPKDTYQFFDINSAYPYAMTFEHPIGDFIEVKGDTKLKGHNFYTFKARSTGAFPYRDADKSLFFPNDNEIREFNCTGWELIAAKELGQLHDFKPISCKMFLETKNFSKYVNYFYALKHSSKKGSPQNIFAKLFLNSAYGKFAANPEKYRETYFIPFDDIQDALCQGYDLHGELHDRFIISKQTDEDTWRHYNVATGASITGFVRAFLYRAIRAVSQPIYCDTDSLLFTGKSRIIQGSELGNWKHEGNFDIAAIGGKKIYALRNTQTQEEKTACKGLILDFDEIMQVCRGESVTKTPHNPIYSIKKGKYFLKKTIQMT